MFQRGWFNHQPGKLHNLAKVCCSTSWAWICQLLSDFLPSFATLSQALASDWINKKPRENSQTCKESRESFNGSHFFLHLRESKKQIVYDRFEGVPLVFCFLPCLGDSVIYPQNPLSLPKFNSSPLKNDGTGRLFSPFRFRYIFRGELLNFQGVSLRWYFLGAKLATCTSL